MDFPTLLKKYNINREQLRRYFGDKTISRGVAYKWQGFVGDIKPEPNLFGGVEVHANVSGNHIYQTTVEISTNSSGPVDVNSYCSCPVEENCKHGAALLYAYLETLNDHDAETIYIDDKSYLEQWLEELATEGEATVEEKGNPNSNHRILYYLEKDSDGTIILKSVKSRELKQGGYGKEAAFSMYEIATDSYYNPNVSYSSIDEEIADILDGNTGYRYTRYNSYTLQGDLGELVLSKIINTGRCYWHHHKTNPIPLSLGSERESIIEWQDQGNSKNIELQSIPTIDYWFKLNTLFYVDLTNNHCGQLAHSNLPLNKLLKLLQAPPIPINKAELISKQLLDKLPNLDIPTPANIGVTTIDVNKQTPIPDVLLHRVLSDNKGYLYVASLRFRYGDHLLQPDNTADVSIITQNTTRYRIYRDVSVEQHALDLLSDYGLIPASHHFIGSFNALDLTMHSLSNLQDIMQWDDFNNHAIPDLAQQGWQFTIDDSFNLQIDEADDWYGELEETDGGAWFEMSLGFKLDGQNLNLLPLLVDILKQGKSPEEVRAYLQSQTSILLPITEEHWVKVPTERLLSVIDTLVELFDTEPLNQDGNLVFSRHQGMHYNDLLNNPDLKWKGAEELQQLGQKIQDFQGIQKVAMPSNLNAELREYQQKGLDWLQFLQEYQFSGILADDMGLGKTLQTLTHLLVEKQADRMQYPNLVIAPTSLMGNWRRESEKFTPDLKVLTLHGSERKLHFETIANYDVVLTTYQLVLRDQAFYDEQQFHYLILDEAQAIKNAKAKTTQAIFQVQAKHRLCLTGTPMENHLGEIWSMFHFLMPGYLGTQERFNRLFRHPIEKHADDIRQKQLRKRIEPFMLRRTKDVVAKELPPKTEIIRTVALQNDQQDLYETVRLAMDKKVREEISKKGVARSQIMILDALLKLRQVCCDPQLVKLDKARNVKGSAKLDLLMTLLPEMIAENRKVLLFSQFVSMLNIIETALKKHNIRYSKLTGQTRKRDEAITAFQEGDASVFLISLKAGGTGLNLTAADTVIHYDPWWNPAVEEQATDRAYRLGQDKPVFVYKLLTENTVEERILSLQNKKRQLAEGLYADKKASSNTGIRVDQNELMALLKPIEQ